MKVLTVSQTRFEEPSYRGVLWALLFANFVIGTGVLLPVGVIDELARDLGTTIPTAGLLITVGGVVIAVGAPLVAALTSAIDRRLLIAAALGLYAAGHAVSAIAPNFSVLLLSRALMIIAAGIVTPQAAATIGALLPPERRSSAITFVFVGWSMALVGGIPLASLIGDHLGWRMAYVVTTLLSVLALVWVSVTIPSGVRVAPLSFASWRAALADPSMVLVLAVTALSSAGQFILFGYLKPYLAGALALAPGAIALMLGWQGAWGIIGNMVAGRFVTRLGEGRTVLLGLLAMLAGLGVMAIAGNVLIAVLFAFIIWGAGTFSSNSAQQARLVVLAPAFASASIALNTSCIYLGQAIGSAAGGGFIAGGALKWLPLAASAVMAAAVLGSILADRITRRRTIQSP